MKIEIDQSGKVEDTSKVTVIADSLGNIVWIDKQEKRYIQKLFRRMGKPQMYMIRTFAVLLSILMSTYPKHYSYVIDIEYPGREAEIKAFIVIYLEKMGLKIDPHDISFQYIGKKSKAHLHTYRSYKNSVNERTGHINLQRLLQALL